MNVHRSALLAGALVTTVAGPVRAADPPKRCVPAGTRTVAVVLETPATTALAGVKIRLDYPRDRVAIPGVMDQDDVKRRVGHVPSGVLHVPNDEDDALVMAMVSTTPIPPGRVFTVELDVCRDAAAIAAADLRCTVEEASDQNAKLVDGARCTVTRLEPKEGAP